MTVILDILLVVIVILLILGAVALFCALWYLIGLCLARVIYKYSGKDDTTWGLITEVNAVAVFWPISFVVFFAIVKPCAIIGRFFQRQYVKWRDKSEFNTISERIIHFVSRGEKKLKAGGHDSSDDITFIAEDLYRRMASTTQVVDEAMKSRPPNPSKPSSYSSSINGGPR